MSDTPSPASSWVKDLSFRLRGYFLNTYGVGAYGSGKYSPRDATRDNWTRVKNVLAGSAAVLAICAWSAIAADTYTTNLNLRKPAVDVEDSDTPWGDKINSDLDTLDVAVCDKRTGCTFSGGLSMTTAAVSRAEFSVAGGTFNINYGSIAIASTGVTGMLGVGSKPDASYRLKVSSGGALLDGTNSALVMTPMAAPTAVKGKLYFDTSTNLLRYSRDGSTFVDLATGSVSGSFINLQAIVPTVIQSGGMSISGAGLFGSTVVVNQNLIVKSSMTVYSGSSVALGVDSSGIIVSTTQPAARGIRPAGTPQSIPSGANTEVSFSGTEQNVGSMFAISATTIPVGGAGLYFVKCAGSYASGSSTGRRVLYPVKNGAGIPGIYDEKLPNSSITTPLTAVGMTYLAEGDVVKCNAYQTSGGNLNLDGASLEVVKLW